MPGQEEKFVSKKLDDNLTYLKEKMEIGEKNFDLIIKEITVGGRKAALFFVDGFADSQTATFILKDLFRIKKEDLAPGFLDKLLMKVIPYLEISTAENMQQIISEVLAGQMAFFLDEERRALLIDIRQYPGREPAEPDIEKITRGSRDGFVETMLFNVTLIRRRIRDPQLRVEIIKVGRRSAGDVALIYIKDVADPQVVAGMRSRLQKIDIDAIPMAEKSVEELIVHRHWNPFPEVRYTERPDVAAVHLLEGHVAVIVDTSPSVIIAPVTFFHHLQHAEEFRQNPLIGTYVRWVRISGVILSVLLIPVWILLAMNKEVLPDYLKFIGPKEQTTIPLYIQFIIAHFGLDLLRMASIHTPSPLATALGLVGALLIGQIAVEVGFFTSEVLLYTGVVAIGLFSTPSWELSMSNRVVLLFLLVLTGLFQLPGFLAGLALVFLRLATTRSFGFPYLWPLIPFNYKALIAVLLRVPLPLQKYRPGFVRVIDTDRTSQRKRKGGR